MGVIVAQASGEGLEVLRGGADAATCWLVSMNNSSSLRTEYEREGRSSTQSHEKKFFVRY